MCVCGGGGAVLPFPFPACSYGFDPLTRVQYCGHIAWSKALPPPVKYHIPLQVTITRNVLSNSNGFQANKSTMQAVMELTKYLYEKRDIGNTIGCLFIDFSKAFNMVSHKILIQKLKAGGLRNQALNWISSYLNNRKQCTRANNIKSSVRLVANGVPQGSC